MEFVLRRGKPQVKGKGKDTRKLKGLKLLVSV